MADLKTPPCNLGAAKFSSISADTALNRPVPELTRNRLGLCLREDLTGSANRVLRGDLFVEINHETQADSIEQILNQFELFPDVESKICIPASTIPIEKTQQTSNSLADQACKCPEILTDGFGLLETGRMLPKLDLNDFEGPLLLTNS
jgi:hypothetical protein